VLSWKMFILLVAIFIAIAVSHRVHTIEQDASDEVGVVSALYTYGAPAISKRVVKNGQTKNGCFPGLRCYTENKRKKTADGGALFIQAQHLKMSILAIDNGTDSVFQHCPEEEHTLWPRGKATDWGLHYEEPYVGRLKNLMLDGVDSSREEPFATANLFTALAWGTYEELPAIQERLAERMPGWNLVGREVGVYANGQDEDPVLLVQHSETLECALAFTGTNNFGEFISSTTQHFSSFCGYKRSIHTGYRDELRRLARDLFPNLRPKMAKCSQVSCVGHSLGGALCDLLAACVNSQPLDSDFVTLQWEKGTPSAMPSVTTCGPSGVKKHVTCT